MLKCGDLDPEDCHPALSDGATLTSTCTAEDIQADRTVRQFNFKRRGARRRQSRSPADENDVPEGTVETLSH